MVDPLDSAGASRTARLPLVHTVATPPHWASAKALARWLSDSEFWRLAGDNGSRSSASGRAAPFEAALYPHRDASGTSRGLRNLGNTCYMNAVVQVCAALRITLSDRRSFRMMCRMCHTGLALCSFTQALFANDAVCSELLRHHGTGSSTDDTVVQFRRVMGQLASSVSKVVDPTRLHHALPEPFNGFAQQDATEFARYLLDTAITVESSMSAADVRRARALTGVCIGTGASVVRCEACTNVSVSLESFTDLSVSTPEQSGRLGRSCRHMTGVSSPWWIALSLALCVAC